MLGGSQLCLGTAGGRQRPAAEPSLQSLLGGSQALKVTNIDHELIVSEVKAGKTASSLRLDVFD